jgi:hypothetical protein
VTEVTPSKRECLKFYGKRQNVKMAGMTAVTAKNPGRDDIGRMKEQSSPNPDLDPLLHTFRGHRVILDADLARLYGVTTSILNQAVKRHPERFPSDFAFQLILEEAEALARSHPLIVSVENVVANRSQAVIGSTVGGDFLQKTRKVPPQFGTGSQKHRDPRYLPWAFTEHKALMAATILRSPRAVHMSL